MTVDKVLVQDVIDRILKYGTTYEKELRNLNEKYEMKFTVHNNVRRYDAREFTGAEQSVRQS